MLYGFKKGVANKTFDKTVPIEGLLDIILALLLKVITFNSMTSKRHYLTILGNYLEYIVILHNMATCPVHFGSDE